MKTSISSCWKVLGVGLVAACLVLAQPGGGSRGFGHGMGRGFAGPVGGLGGPLGGSLLRATVTGAPFSATETFQSQRALENGSQLQNQQQSKLYRDSQGRVRIDSTVARPTAGSGATAASLTLITIYDPVAGKMYRLNPATMTAIESPIPQRLSSSGATRPTRTPPAGVTVETKDLGTQTINGVSATGTQVTTTIAAGTMGNSAAIQSVTTTWVSTALKIPVQITTSDPRSGSSAMNLANIAQAEPDESLFRVPSGYTVKNAPAGGAGARWRAGR